MTDYFAVLGEARRPWIDAEVLKQKFLSLSVETHPDRVHSVNTGHECDSHRRYTELNTAYQCLREPKDRLRHLIELERGSKPDQIQRIPPDLMTLSLEVGEACRAADKILEEKAKTDSPLLQVGLFRRAQEATEQLLAFQQRVQSRREGLLNEVRGLDAAWSNARSAGASVRTGMLARLEELYRLLSYCEKWSAQVRERIVQLSF